MNLEEGPVDLYIKGHQYDESMPIYGIDCKNNTNMREDSEDTRKNQHSFEKNFKKRTLGTRKHTKLPERKKFKATDEIILD